MKFENKAKEVWLFDFKLILSRVEIEKISHRIIERQKECVELLEKFHINLSQVLYWRKKLIEVAENLQKFSMKEASSQKNSADAKEILKEKILYYQDKIWESEEALQEHNQQWYIQDFVKLIDEKLQEVPSIYFTERI
jgi:hypothetical protein